MDENYVIDGTKIIDREQIELADKKEALKKGLSSWFGYSLLDVALERLPR